MDSVFRVNRGACCRASERSLIKSLHIGASELNLYMKSRVSEI